MSTPNDGGPAFPCTIYTNPDAHPTGMSLRDYAAIKAMQGMLASDLAPDMSLDQRADYAYAQADAMLRARVKP